MPRPAIMATILCYLLIKLFLPIHYNHHSISGDNNLLIISKINILQDLKQTTVNDKSDYHNCFLCYFESIVNYFYDMDVYNAVIVALLLIFIVKYQAIIIARFLRYYFSCAPPAIFYNISTLK
jgi:hypothetical protein